MRRVMLAVAGLLLLAPAHTFAQTADEIVAKYIKTIGGMEKIQAVKSLRRTGKYTGGGGFEAASSKRTSARTWCAQEFSLQGMTGVNAYDGQTGWKIEPWNGKKDAEPLGEEEMKRHRRRLRLRRPARQLPAEGEQDRVRRHGAGRRHRRATSSR